jgi:hypothetical protein
MCTRLLLQDAELLEAKLSKVNVGADKLGMHMIGQCLPGQFKSHDIATQ